MNLHDWREWLARLLPPRRDPGALPAETRARLREQRACYRADAAQRLNRGDIEGAGRALAGSSMPMPCSRAPRLEVPAAVQP